MASSCLSRAGVLLRIPVVAPRGAQDTRPCLPGLTTLRVRREEGAVQTHPGEWELRGLGYVSLQWDCANLTERFGGWLEFRQSQSVTPGRLTPGNYQKFHSVESDWFIAVSPEPRTLAPSPVPSLPPPSPPTPSPPTPQTIRPSFNIYRKREDILERGNSIPFLLQMGKLRPRKQR